MFTEELSLARYSLETMDSEIKTKEFTEDDLEEVMKELTMLQWLLDSVGDRLFANVTYSDGR